MTRDPMMVLFTGADLIVDATGPDPMTVQRGESMHVDMADEPLEVQFAAVGMPGRDGADGGADIEALAADAMPAGMPAAISRATGNFIKADAGFKPSAFVAGLLRAQSAVGFVAAAAVQQLTLADWSAVTGTVTLAAGQPYFLATGGGLSTVAPATGCVALIGKALNSTTMLINPQPPIER